MTFKIRNGGEDRISSVLCMVVFGLYAVNIMPGIEKKLGISHEVISAIIKAILVLGFVSCMDVLFRRLKKTIVVYCVITILVILISLTIFSRNNFVFVHTAVTFLGLCFLPMIFYGIVGDFENLYRKLLKTSECIAVVTAVLLVLSTGRFGSFLSFSLGYYSMGFGYACLVPWMFLAMEFIKKPDLQYGLYAAIILAGIVLMGSRGPLVSIAVFTVMIFVKSNHEKKRDYLILLGFLAGIGFLLFSRLIVIFLYNFLDSLGFSSRTLTLLATNRGYSTGRGDLYRFFWKEILANPFAVHGINGDQAMGLNYPHNLFLELFYQFGIVLGGAIAAAIVFQAIRTLKSDSINTDPKQQIKSIFMCASLPGMMLSGTLWTEANFWIWVALSHNRCGSRRKKVEKRRSG